MYSVTGLLEYMPLLGHEATTSGSCEGEESPLFLTRVVIEADGRVSVQFRCWHR